MVAHTKVYTFDMELNLENNNNVCFFQITIAQKSVYICVLQMDIQNNCIYLSFVK